ncbi:MAG TPA: hypothetical protein VGJ21_06565, partial [Terracidiphilus sp.]
MSEHKLQTRLIAAMAGAAVALGVGGAMYAKGHERRDGDAGQETEAAKTQNAQSTTLNDQTDLNVTIYNSNIALVRDVRQLT